LTDTAVFRAVGRRVGVRSPPEEKDYTETMGMDLEEIDATIDAALDNAVVVLADPVGTFYMA
jgi:hypothetical protein